MQPIVVHDVSVSFRDVEALSGVDLVAQPGRRIGLVGENGVGKSTLLRAVAGRLPPTARVGGSIQAPPLTFLGQEPPFADEHTVADVLAATLAPLRRAVAEVERLAGRLDEPGAAQAYAEALELATGQDAWDADRRALLAAQRLGLADLDGARRVGTLSGGERTRLALATIMTTRPGCLLLDEPTNHLDDDAIGVLTEFLVGLPGVVLLASHDRVLLDEVCTDLVDLDATAFGTDGQGGRRFGGGWTDYEQARLEARRRWEATYAEQQEELGRLRAATRVDTSSVAHGRGPRDNDRFIHEFKGSRVDKTLARRKRDAQQRLEVAEREQVRRPPAPLRFRTTLAGSAGGGRMVHVRDLHVAGRLRVPRLDVSAGEKVLVTGPNGSGKSTLLGVLSGRLVPSRGAVQVNARRAVELTQDPQLPDLARSAGQVYDAATAGRDDVPPLRELGLVHPRDVHRAVGSLSTGQRRRLALAVAVAQSPDLMLLDEPTNHLSLALVGELEAALSDSTGTVLVASHDRWLRRRWEGAELALDPGGAST